MVRSKFESIRKRNVELLYLEFGILLDDYKAALPRIFAADGTLNKEARKECLGLESQCREKFRVLKKDMGIEGHWDMTVSEWVKCDDKEAFIQRLEHVAETVSERIAYIREFGRETIDVGVPTPSADQIEIGNSRIPRPTDKEQTEEGHEATETGDEKTAPPKAGAKECQTEPQAHLTAGQEKTDKAAAVSQDEGVTFELQRDNKNTIKLGTLKKGASQNKYTLTSRPARAMRELIIATNEGQTDPEWIKERIIECVPEWSELNKPSKIPDLGHEEKEIRKAVRAVFNSSYTPWHRLPAKIRIVDPRR